MFKNWPQLNFFFKKKPRYFTENLNFLFLLKIRCWIHSLGVALIGPSAIEATLVGGPECTIVPPIPWGLYLEHFTHTCYLCGPCGHLSLRHLLFADLSAAWDFLPSADFLSKFPVHFFKDSFINKCLPSSPLCLLNGYTLTYGHFALQHLDVSLEVISVLFFP